MCIRDRTYGRPQATRTQDRFPTYGTENLNLLKKHKSKLQASGARYLSHSRRERLRNMTLRNLFQQESVVEIAERRALQWFGHTMRTVSYTHLDVYKRQVFCQIN